VGQVRVHARKDEFVMIVGDVGETVGDFACVVVVHDGDGADRAMGVGPVLDFHIRETVADEIAYRLGTVGISLPLDERVEFIEKILPDGYPEPDKILFEHMASSCA
jgi:hypothetical protein